MYRSSYIFKVARFCLERQFRVQKFPVSSTSALFRGNNLLLNHSFVRHYAKGKNKLKEDKGKGKKKHTEINESFLEQAINVEKFKAELLQCISSMKETFISQISLRSTTGSIENLNVSFEGQKYTLIELAHIVRKNPKTLIINMNAFPQAIPSVLKAIASSGMNLNPQQDGTTLFIPIPKVTREYREALAKNAKAHFIKCRDNIRNVQNKYLKDLKKKDGLSEDDIHLMSQQVKHFADQSVAEAEKLFQLKESELLGEN